MTELVSQMDPLRTIWGFVSVLQGGHDLFVTNQSDHVYGTGFFRYLSLVVHRPLGLVGPEPLVAARTLPQPLSRSS